MRLSTAPDRDEERAIDVVRAALDAGATLLDTADAYCHDESDIGHNERLIARALAGWSGDRSRITVATKGGIRRPKGAWVNDGRAKHLRDACDASRRSLRVETIDLYQLHAVDPKTPFDTSVRALATLQREGAIRDVGLCNVTVGQIEQARSIVDVASVQVSLSVIDDESLRNGVAEYCRDHGIRLIAYRPLGGVDRARKLAPIRCWRVWPPSTRHRRKRSHLPGCRASQPTWCRFREPLASKRQSPWPTSSRFNWTKRMWCLSTQNIPAVCFVFHECSGVRATTPPETS
jgi:aryl-alcohol dehydrogenase-like predicted oxidoreductase